MLTSVPLPFLSTVRFDAEARPEATSSVTFVSGVTGTSLNSVVATTPSSCNSLMSNVNVPVSYPLMTICWGEPVSVKIYFTSPN